MKNLVFLFCFIPVIALSQTMISVNTFERKDAQKHTIDKFDISIGSFISNNLLAGITNENAVADYIEDGFNPVKDSLIVSDFQLFLKYYDDRGFFLLMKMPISGNGQGISSSNRIRAGGGYIFYSHNNLDFDISYNVLVSPNLNGFHKGVFRLGISTDISNFNAYKHDIKLPTTSFVPNLLNKVISWINTPLPNGYRESVLN
jgi:hypothetical protein